MPIRQLSRSAAKLQISASLKQWTDSLSLLSKPRTPSASVDVPRHKRDQRILAARKLVRFVLSLEGLIQFRDEIPTQEAVEASVDILTSDEVLVPIALQHGLQSPSDLLYIAAKPFFAGHVTFIDEALSLLRPYLGSLPGKLLESTNVLFPPLEVAKVYPFTYTQPAELSEDLVDAGELTNLVLLHVCLDEAQMDQDRALTPPEDCGRMKELDMTFRGAMNLAHYTQAQPIADVPLEFFSPASYDYDHERSTLVYVGWQLYDLLQSFGVCRVFQASSDLPNWVPAIIGQTLMHSDTVIIISHSLGVTSENVKMPADEFLAAIAYSCIIQPEMPSRLASTFPQLVHSLAVTMCSATIGYETLIPVPSLDRQAASPLPFKIFKAQTPDDLRNLVLRSHFRRQLCRISPSVDLSVRFIGGFNPACSFFEEIPEDMRVGIEPLVPPPAPLFIGGLTGSASDDSFGPFDLDEDNDLHPNVTAPQNPADLASHLTSAASSPPTSPSNSTHLNNPNGDGGMESDTSSAASVVMTESANTTQQTTPDTAPNPLPMEHGISASASPSSSSLPDSGVAPLLSSVLVALAVNNVPFDLNAGVGSGPSNLGTRAHNEGMDAEASEASGSGLAGLSGRGGVDGSDATGSSGARLGA